MSISDHQPSIFDLFDTGKSSGSESDPAQELELYKAKCLLCRQCALRQSCQQVVFGTGNSSARLLLIGEAPGAEEDRTGEPFVGKAGQLLDSILFAVELTRQEVYIANIVKCRPPGNRLPAQQEVEACLPHLKKQVELINPRIILCLGALATRTLIDRNASITRSRGRWHQVDGRQIMATFHPAALLRDPGKKKDVWDDIREVKKIYAGLGG